MTKDVRTPPTGIPITDAELEQLPPTIDIVTAGRILGIGRTQAYALHKAGDFPVATFKIGQRYKVATRKVLAYLRESAA